jgi:hypothetical protein
MPGSKLAAGSIATVLGFIGGIISGGLTAWVQVSDAKQKYSIERAKEFKSLLQDLQSQEKSRLALLNLWQLYPDSRDQKIIAMAAIALNQPDLVQLISGIDGGEIGDYLEARARDGNQAALDSLAEVNPLGAATIVLDQISEYIKESGDHPISEDWLANRKILLASLMHGNTSISNLVKSKYAVRQAGGFSREPPIVFDELLYDAESSDRLASRFVEAYAAGGQVEDYNAFLIQTQFRPEHRGMIVEAVGEYVVTKLGDASAKESDIAGALKGLSNGVLGEALAKSLPDGFTRIMYSVVIDQGKSDEIRQRAMRILQSVAPDVAIFALANVASRQNYGDLLFEELVTQGPNVFREAQTENAILKIPENCALDDFSPCIKEGVLWRNWLETQVDHGSSK